MIGVYLLLGLAALMFVAAVFIYSRSEDNSYSKLLSTIQESKDESKSVNNQCAVMSQTLLDLNSKINKLDAETASSVSLLSTELKKIRDTNDIMVVRQHSLEKKIIAKDRTVNVNIIEQQKAKAKPLLERAGVKQ
jgi:hypothetical protein